MIFNRRNKEFILILLAVFCQFFVSSGTYFMQSYAPHIIKFNSMSLTAFIHTFLIYWFVFSFIGRISGAYFFGKYANKLNFFQIMRLVSLGHLLVAFLIANVCSTTDYYCNNSSGFYLACFLYSFLEPATILLPAIYFLSKSPASQHIHISASLILTTFLGKFFAESCAYYIPSQYMQTLYWLPILTSFLALVIYNHVEKHAPLLENIVKVTKHSTLSMHKKILTLAIGATCNAGITYYYSFLNPYLVDVLIMHSCSFIRSQLPLYIIFALFLLPAATICQKFGILKTLITSISLTFILGIFMPFMATSDFIYALYQILFACSLASFVAPSLAVIYQLFENTKDKFNMIFWFSLGASFSMLCVSIGSTMGFSLHFPLAGLLIFAIIILVSLAGIFTKNFQNICISNQHE